MRNLGKACLLMEHTNTSRCIAWAYTGRSGQSLYLGLSRLGVFHLDISWCGSWCLL